MSLVRWLYQQPPKEGGGSFYTCPKNSCWELASKSLNIQFWNKNIQNLNYSRCRQNRTIRFGKSNCPIFPGSVICVVYEVTVFHSSHLVFYAILSFETLLVIHVVSLLIEGHAYTQD
jgi:hypothetical protein